MLDVQGVVVTATEEGVVQVEQVVLGSRVIGEIPLDGQFVGVRVGAFHLEVRRSSRRVGSTVGDGNLADVHLVIVDWVRPGLDDQAQGGDLLTRVLREVYSCGLPAVACPTVCHVHRHYSLGVVGENEAELQLGIVAVELVVGQFDLGAGSDAQVGLVETDGVVAGQLAAQHQRIAAFVAADLGVVKAWCRFIFLAIVEVGLQRVGIGINPPLPCRQNVLEVDIAPLLVAGLFAVVSPFETMTGVERCGEDRTADDGALGDLRSETLPAIAARTIINIRIRYIRRALLTGGRTSPQTAFAVEYLVLILRVDLLVVTQLVGDEIGAKCRKAHIGLAVSVKVDIHIIRVAGDATKFLLSGLDTREYRVLRINAKALGVIS